MENTTKKGGMEGIAEYIKDLKFKKAVVGGIDPENAYSEMRTLVSMFNDVYNAEAQKTADAEKKVEELTAALDDEKSRNEARLRSIEEQTIQHLEKSRNENIELKKRLEAAGSDGEEKIRAQKRITSLEGHVTSLEETIRNLKIENSEIKGELSEAQAKCKEIDFRKETLEDIYLDANRKRTDMIEKATKDAEAIIKEAEAQVLTIKENAVKENDELIAKNESLKNENETMASEVEAKRAAMLEECEKEAAEVRAKNEAENAEIIKNAQAKSEEIIAEANTKADAIAANAKAEGEAAVAKANEEAKEIVANAEKKAAAIKTDVETRIAEAKAAYTEKSRKFNDMAGKMNALRDETLKNIQNDMTRMQELAAGLNDTKIDLMADID